MVRSKLPIFLSGNLRFKIWRSNQSILKEPSPGCSLEGLMLMLKLQYFGHLMWRLDSLEKTLMLEGLKAGEGMTEDEMIGWHHRFHGREFEQALGVGGWTGRPGVLQSIGLQRVRHDWATELNILLGWMNCFSIVYFQTVVRTVATVFVTTLGDPPLVAQW